VVLELKVIYGFVSEFLEGFVFGGFSFYSADLPFGFAFGFLQFAFGLPFLIVC
jgi:hypothetical protein